VTKTKKFGIIEVEQERPCPPPLTSEQTMNNDIYKDLSELPVGTKITVSNEDGQRFWVELIDDGEDEFFQVRELCDDPTISTFYEAVNAAEFIIKG
jgi:hypothetical protein